MQYRAGTGASLAHVVFGYSTAAWGASQQEKLHQAPPNEGHHVPVRCTNPAMASDLLVVWPFPSFAALHLRIPTCSFLVRLVFDFGLLLMHVAC